VESRFTPLFQESDPRTALAAPDLTAFYIGHLPPGLHLEHALDRLAPCRGCSGRADRHPAALAEPLTQARRRPNDSLWASSYWFYQVFAP
jgi:hypothetical protein